MASMTYGEFGEYLGIQSPYSAPGDVTFDPGFNDLSTGVTKVATPATVPFDARWQWRHARPWKNEPPRPGRPDRPHKVRSYPITKALLVPYTYKRKLDSTFGGDIVGSGATSFPGPGEVHINIKAHLLIGYTGQLPLGPEAEQPRSEDDATIGAYPDLGRLIRDQTPMADPAAGRLPVLLEGSGVPEDSNASEDQHLEIAETWLSAISWEKVGLGLCELESNSDMEMDLIQEQQCLFWGFPLEVGTPNAWLRYFQVTKAFRASYRITAPDPTLGNALSVFEGDVLVGVTGAGDM